MKDLYEILDEIDDEECDEHKRENKWAVYGEYGGHFSRLSDAKKCAKECSTYPEYNYNAKIWLWDSVWYIEYDHGKLVRDDWSFKKK